MNFCYQYQTHDILTKNWKILEYLSVFIDLPVVLHRRSSEFDYRKLFKDCYIPTLKVLHLNSRDIYKYFQDLKQLFPNLSLITIANCNITQQDIIPLTQFLHNIDNVLLEVLYFSKQYFSYLFEQGNINKIKLKNLYMTLHCTDFFNWKSFKRTTNNFG